MCKCELCDKRRSRWASALHYEVVEHKTARIAANSVSEMLLIDAPKGRIEAYHEVPSSSFAGAGYNTQRVLEHSIGNPGRMPEARKRGALRKAERLTGLTIAQLKELGRDQTLALLKAALAKAAA